MVDAFGNKIIKLSPSDIFNNDKFVNAYNNDPFFNKAVIYLIGGVNTEQLLTLILDVCNTCKDIRSALECELNNRHIPVSCEMVSAQEQQEQIDKDINLCDTCVIKSEICGDRVGKYVTFCTEYKNEKEK